MNLVKIAALFETSLQEKITSSSTSMTLVSATDKDGNALSGLYGFVINEGAANEEFVIGTVSGTTVSGLLRRISVSNPNTTGTGLSHRRGETVKITNYPILEQIAKILRSGGTIEGLLEFLNTARPKLDTDVDALVDTEFVTKGELSRTALGALTSSRILVSGSAGETLAAGNLIYLKTSDSLWYLCDADTAATVENVVLGISQGVATVGNPIPGGVLLRGIDTNNTVTASTIYYASNTAGGISTTPGTKEVTIGISLPSSTTQLYFLPRFNQGITEDIQDSLETTASGTALSAANVVVDRGFMAENTPSKGVIRKADGTIAGDTKEVNNLIAGEAIAERDICSMAEITESFATGTDTRNVGSDTASNTDKYVAQGFQLPVTQKIYSGTITIKKVSAPTKDVRVAIYSDTAGSPNASLGYYDIPYQSITTSFQTLTWVIPAGISITADTQYHIVVSTADLSMDSTNYYQLESLTSGTYAYGQTKLSSNGSTWNADGTRDCYFSVTYLGALKYDSDDSTRTYIGNLIVADAAIAQRASGSFVVRGKKTGYGLTLYSGADSYAYNYTAGGDAWANNGNNETLLFSFPMINQITFLKTFSVQMDKSGTVTGGTYTIRLLELPDGDSGTIAGSGTEIYNSGTLNATSLTTSWTYYTQNVYKKVKPGAYYQIEIRITSSITGGGTIRAQITNSGQYFTYATGNFLGTIAANAYKINSQIIGTNTRTYVIGDYLYGTTTAGSFATTGTKVIGKLLDADTIDVGNIPTGNTYLGSVLSSNWPANTTNPQYNKNVSKIPDSCTKIIVIAQTPNTSYNDFLQFEVVLSKNGKTTGQVSIDSQTVSFYWAENYIYASYSGTPTTNSGSTDIYFYN